MSNPVPNTDPELQKTRDRVLYILKTHLSLHPDQDEDEVYARKIAEHVHNHFVLKSLPQQPERTTAKFAVVVENPTPLDSGELRKRLLGLHDVTHYQLADSPCEDCNEFDENLAAYTQAKVEEAQTNAVAWCVGVVDEIHSQHDEYQHDRAYKGVKNTLRDRYKAETGVDPAPNYPVNVQLKASNRQENQ